MMLSVAETEVRTRLERIYQCELKPIPPLSYQKTCDFKTTLNGITYHIEHKMINPLNPHKIYTQHKLKLKFMRRLYDAHAQLKEYTQYAKQHGLLLGTYKNVLVFTHAQREDWVLHQFEHALFNLLRERQFQWLFTDIHYVLLLHHNNSLAIIHKCKRQHQLLKAHPLCN